MSSETEEGEIVDLDCPVTQKALVRLNLIQHSKITNISRLIRDSLCNKIFL